jgi:hypothetical protein
MALLLADDMRRLVSELNGLERKDNAPNGRYLIQMSRVTSGANEAL